MFPNYTYIAESTQVINRKKPHSCFRMTQKPENCDDTNTQCFVNYVMPRYKFEDAFISCSVPREIYRKLNLIQPKDYFQDRIEKYLAISRKEVVLKWTFEKKLKEYKENYDYFIKQNVYKYIEKLTIVTDEYMKMVDYFDRVMKYFKNEKYKIDFLKQNSAYKYEDYLSCCKIKLNN